MPVLHHVTVHSTAAVALACTIAIAVLFSTGGDTIRARSISAEARQALGHSHDSAHRSHGAASRADKRASQVAPVPAVVPAGRWNLELSQRDGRHFLAAVASAPALARQLAAEFDSHTTVRVSSACAPRSCASADIMIDGDERTATYEIDLHRSHVGASRASRFLMLHEVGHLVQYEYLDESSLAQIEEAFRSSPAWRDCFAAGGECVPLDELFADQFAIYASGEARSMTAYRTPRLLPSRRFATLLRDATAR